jgi:Questin oxidase-like
MVEARRLAAHSMTMDASFTELKATAHRDSVEFPPLMANHLPMILVALDRLGATSARLTAFDRSYRSLSGLVPPPPKQAALSAGTWQSALGQRARETDLRDFFTAQVARRGSAATIRAALPVLAPGIAGSALHPLMRLAYAVMAEDEAEVGAALGFWAATHLPLDDTGTGAGFTADPAEVLRRASVLPGLADAEPESDLVWHNMRAVAAMPSFHGIADWLIVTPDTLDRMASTSLALFAGTMSFEALHAVTGCHWLRLLEPVSPAMAPSLRHFWVAIAALIPKMGFPEIPSDAQLSAWRNTPSPDWPQIKAAAIASDDEHDHSLTFSAFEEWRRTGDALYRYVAAKRVGLAG